MPTSDSAPYKFAIATAATSSDPTHVVVAAPDPSTVRYRIPTDGRGCSDGTVTIKKVATARGLPTGSTSALNSHIPRLSSGYINPLRDGTRLIRVNANGTFTEVLDPQNTLVSAG